MKYDALRGLAHCIRAALWHYGRGSHGEKPADMLGAAVDQIRAINQSVRALGIKVPPGLRSVADEVIE